MVNGASTSVVRFLTNETVNTKSVVHSNVVKICKTCYQEVSKGKSHICGRSRLIHKNLVKVKFG